MSWMLPLLLLALLNSFHHSSSAPTGMHGFGVELGEFSKIVKSCSENCSSIDVTDLRCKCLNINVSQSECLPHDYFIVGLKSLHPSISQQWFVKNLIYSLENMKINFTATNWCLDPSNSEPFISPKSLTEKLKHFGEIIYSDSAN